MKRILIASLCCIPIFLYAVTIGSARAEFIEVPDGQLPEDIAKFIFDLNSPKSINYSIGQNSSNLSAKIDFDLLDSEKKLRNAKKLLGKGYDVWGGRLFETCVSADDASISVIEKAPGVPNPHSTYIFRQIDGLKDYHANRSSGGSFSIAYDLLAVGGEVSEYKTSSYQFTSRYVDAHIVAVADEFRLDAGTPTPEASAMITSGDMSKFTKRCGQRFISSVGFGTAIDAQLNFRIKVDKSSSVNGGKIDVGIGAIFGGAAETKQKIAELSAFSTIDVSVKGGQGKVPTPDQFIDYVRSFPVTSSSTYSYQTVFIETKPYSEIGATEFDNFDDVLMIAPGVVQASVSDMASVKQQLANLSLARDNPEIFTSPAPASLPDLFKEREDFLNRLGYMYSVCRNAVDAKGVQGCREARVQLGAAPVPVSFAFAPSP